MARYSNSKSLVAILFALATPALSQADSCSEALQQASRLSQMVSDLKIVANAQSDGCRVIVYGETNTYISPSYTLGAISKTLDSLAATTTSAASDCDSNSYSQYLSIVNQATADGQEAINCLSEAKTAP